MSGSSAIVAEIERLRDLNGALRAENRRLRQILASDAPLEIGVRMPRRERQILSYLLRVAPSIVPHERLFVACFENHDEIAIEAIQPHVCKLNKKLRPLDARIECEKNEGYFLSSQSAAAIRSAVARGKGVCDG